MAGPQYRPGHALLIQFGTGPANYWFTFISDPLTVGFLVFWELFILRSHFLLVITAFLMGVFVWTLVEYVFHRFVYHKGHTPAHTGHMVHHKSPERLIAMPWFVVTTVYALMWYLVAMLLRVRLACTVAAGLLAGFVFYGAFHHILHRCDFKSHWYRKMRAYHLVHHRFPDVNFGVTNHFWDHVFGTTRRDRTARSQQQIIETESIGT